MRRVNPDKAGQIARPRVIRGTRTALLPFLRSGPGVVCSRPLHGARDLTSIHRSMRGAVKAGVGWRAKSALIAFSARPPYVCLLYSFGPARTHFQREESSPLRQT